MIVISNVQHCKAQIWYNFLIHGLKILLVAFGFKFLNNDKIYSQVDLNVGLVEEVQIQVDNEIVLSFDLHELSSKIEIDSFIL